MLFSAATATAETGAATTVGGAACHVVLRGADAIGATTTAALALPVRPACLARQSEPINFDIRSSWCGNMFETSPGTSLGRARYLLQRILNSGRGSNELRNL